MRKIVIYFLRIYQVLLSPDQGLLKKIGLVHGSVCSFYPTCSEYSIKAIEKYGVLRGSVLTIKRIGRCRPGHEGEIDNP